MGHIGRFFRLTNEPGGLGPSCTGAGLSLAGVPLLQKSENGFVPRSAAEIEALVQAAYDGDVAASNLLPSVHVVARALNRGEIAHAMTAAVLMRLPELSWDAAARLAHAEDRLSKYSPDEPRDWHGRWTTGGAAHRATQEEPDNSDGSGDDSARDDRPPLERKYDELGPVAFSRQVIQFGWRLGADGQGFSPERRQEALAEYNFLQDRLNFWLTYDDKPLEAQQNLLSAAQSLYEGAVNGKIVPVGGKGGDLPASMLAVATGTLAVDNGTPGVRLRGPVRGAEFEPELAPLEHEPAPSEEEAISSPGQSVRGEPGHIVEELKRTGELSEEVIPNDEAKIDWNGSTNTGIQWEDYNEIRYPNLTRLKPGAKAFDFFDDASGEALSDKAIDPLSYYYINNPQDVYDKISKYIRAAENYNKQRVESDLYPSTINSRYLRLAVHNHISPKQWEYIYKAVLYARNRGIKITIWRID